MSPFDKLVFAGSMPLGQGEHLLVPSMAGYSPLYPRQNSLLSVGQEPLCPSPVAGSGGYGLSKKSLRPLRPAAAEVALANLDPHNLAATGDVEAALGSLMSFKLRHFETP
jgi:hypothetical protein